MRNDCEKIGLLGPLGTFTEEAAVKYFDGADAGCDFVPYRTISEVFRAVKGGEVLRGVVPMENLLNGHVLETLDNLYDSDVKIQGAVVLPIYHCLAARSDVGDITVVKSHRQALAQCSEYLDVEYPDADRVEALSTAAAMEEIAENGSKNFAAIGSRVAVDRYDLNILDSNIGNNEDNKTMFIVIGGRESERSARSRTSLVMVPSANEPGVLGDMLKSFSDENVDLKMIQSRPDGNGGYIFYVDIEGHIKDDNVARSLEKICDGSEVKIFGSYPYVSLSGI